ncbi:MAG: VWA domain-containing protein, partial [Planctomycetes bacterium]|nr:VWA domain-containing protein [Planctomycetota bacterium]
MSRDFELFVLELLRVDTSDFPLDAGIRYDWLNAPQSWQVFILLGVVAIVIYGVVHLYLRELKTCPKRVAVGLAVVRASVLLLLLVIFLNPAVAHSERRVIEPYVLVLIDNSASIGHRDYYLDDRYIGPVEAASELSADEIREKGLTRAELLNKLFARNDGKFLKDLEAKGKVKIIMLYVPKPKQDDGAGDTEDPAAGDVEAPEPSADEPPTDDTPGRVVIQTGEGQMGKYTHLARAIREAIGSVAGSPIAGIILITDGQDNARDDDPVDAAEFAAQRTKKKGGVQIYPIAVGDASPPRNLQVVELDAKEIVWQGDEFEITAVLSANGLGDQSVQVELYQRLIEREGGQPVTNQEEHVETQSKLLPADGAVRTVTFKHSQKTLGRYAYYVRVKPMEHESRNDDNERQIQVYVRNNKSRVLLIA